ncbi:hypothetical protein PaG_06111 [Moesziomyces aphidis]|uniref:Uncharacterized protein n=1 Tax=Moesziomyces aphidis TaxID=84754 RepID=W3VH39_MOEAP|nr:hypothetical protein PaG_06111 [Moesziomyces aphidis]
MGAPRQRASVCARRGGAEWSGLLELALLAVMTVTVAKAMVVIAEQQQQQQLKRAIAPNESRESCRSGTAALQRRALRFAAGCRRGALHIRIPNPNPSRQAAESAPPMIGLVIGGHGCLQILHHSAFLSSRHSPSPLHCRRWPFHAATHTTPVETSS